MPILLNVNVRNKIAKGDGQIVVCDNSDYIVNFDFDSEWDEFKVKTMRLVFSNGEFNEVVFEGNQCDLPVIQSRNGFSIGVYAGNIHTTVSAWFDCAKSILTDGEQHGEPAPDVYAQIIEMIESGMIKGDPGEDGNGIESIDLISTVGRAKTYRITFTDGETYDYQVTDGEKGDPGNDGKDGNGIQSVNLISTVDRVKTYRITFTDGTHYDYNVTDGEKGDPGEVSIAYLENFLANYRANGYGQYKFFRTQANYGITVLGTGIICADDAKDENIERQAKRGYSGYGIISTANIKKAVEIFGEKKIIQAYSAAALERDYPASEDLVGRIAVIAGFDTAELEGFFSGIYICLQVDEDGLQFAWVPFGIQEIEQINERLDQLEQIVPTQERSLPLGTPLDLEGQYKRVEIYAYPNSQSKGSQVYTFPIVDAQEGAKSSVTPFEMLNENLHIGYNYGEFSYTDDESGEEAYVDNPLDKTIIYITQSGGNFGQYGNWYCRFYK